MSESQSRLSRRNVVAGAGVAGAAAVVATVLMPRVQPGLPPTKEVSALPVHDGGGYRESEHVLHYYRTARV